MSLSFFRSIRRSLLCYSAAPPPTVPSSLSRGNGEFIAPTQTLLYQTDPFSIRPIMFALASFRFLRLSQSSHFAYSLEPLFFCSSEHFIRRSQSPPQSIELRSHSPFGREGVIAFLGPVSRLPLRDPPKHPSSTFKRFFFYFRPSPSSIVFPRRHLRT